MDSTEVRLPRLPPRPTPVWPEVLLAAFPLAPDRNPLRPWWRAIPLRGAADYDDFVIRCKIVRADERVLEDSPLWVHHDNARPRNPDFRDELDFCDGRVPGGYLYDAEDYVEDEDHDPWAIFRAMEEEDREHPRPHPGFRAGQVWAALWPYEPGKIRTYQIVGYYGDTLRFLVPAEDGVSLYTEEQLRALLDGAFLVADVACPHLAPWAPEAPKAP